MLISGSSWTDVRGLRDASSSPRLTALSLHSSRYCPGCLLQSPTKTSGPTHTSPTLSSSLGTGAGVSAAFCSSTPKSSHVRRGQARFGAVASPRTRWRETCTRAWASLTITFSSSRGSVEQVRSLSLRERRAQLEEVVENDHTLILPARRLAGNGLEAWTQAVAAGYEGMVAKGEASLYKGGRTLSWLKVKQRNYRIEERGWEQKG